MGTAADTTLAVVDPSVSRLHCELSQTEQGVRIKDLGSKNGTYLREVSVTKPARLADGDQIRLGSVVITFRVPGPTSLTETASA